MITIIEGPKKSGKTTVAVSMRNAHIGKSVPDGKSVPYGCLLIDEDQDGEPRHLIEKLLHGAALPADGSPIDAKGLPWKQDPQVVIIGDNSTKWLKAFEKLVPGFAKKVGPVKKLKLADA